MKILRYYLIVLAYLALTIPFWSYSGFVSPFIFTQTTALQSIALAAFVPLLVLWIYVPSARPPRDKALLLPLVYLGSLLASALTGVNPVKSLVGSWERFGSVADWLAIFVYGAVLFSVFQKQEERQRYLRTLVVFATTQAVYALLQLVPGTFAYTEGQRIYGTIGNPAFLASYLVLSIGLTLSVLCSASRPWRSFMLTSIVLQIVALLCTETKAAMIALLIAGLVLCLAWSSGRIPSMRRSALRFLGIVGIIVFFSLVYLTSPLAQNQAFQNILRQESFSSRFSVWGIGLKGFVDRPVLGFGQENFIVIFQRHFEPRLYRGQQDSIWFDRSHNEYIDRLALGGIIGFVAYLFCLLGLPMISLYRSRSHETAGAPMPERVLLAFALGYAAYLFFFFHSTADALLWPIYLLLIYHGSAPELLQKPGQVSRIPALFIGLSFVCSALLIGSSTVQAVRANALIAKAIDTSSLDQAMEYYTAAWPLDIRGRRVIVPALFDRIGYALPFTTPAYVSHLQRWSEDTAQRYPHELRYQRLLILVYRALGVSTAHVDQIASLGIVLAPQHPEPYLLRGLLSMDKAAAAGDDATRRTQMAMAHAEFIYARELAPGAHNIEILFQGSQEDATASRSALRDYADAQKGYLKTDDWIVLIQVAVYYHDLPLLEHIREQLYGTGLNAVNDPTTVRIYIDQVLAEIAVVR